MAYTVVDYSLYNEDLSTRIDYNVWASGSESSPSTYRYDVVLSAGTYYFKIYKGGSGKYTFTISALTPSNCTHDYQTTTVDPTYTSQGYTLHKCKKCGYSYKDNYQAALKYECTHSYRTTVIPPDYVKQGYSVHRCSKCGHSYTDNYRAKLVLSTPWIYYVSAGRKRATISWSSVSAASGYQISCKARGYSKKVKVKGGYNTKKTIKRLRPKKKYSFRVRAYKTVNGKTVYSKWSSKRTAKIR